MARIYAAADIGSNTAHLLVAASDGELVMRVDNYNEWIPLGEVVARHRSIPKEMVEQLLLALKEFKRMSSQEQSGSLYVFATEGMRAASNHATVLKRIREATGVEVEIVSPRREAELSLSGALLDCRHLGMDILLEVGGGSAQIASVERNQLKTEESLPLGTGKLIAESGITNPCPEYAMIAAENYISSVLERSKVVLDARMAVVSGGVARGLWRAVHPDGEKMLSMEEIEYVVWSTSRLSVDRIIQRFNVKPKRAGTLLPGALVYRALMQRYGVRQIAISEFGVREGAVIEMARGRIKGCAL